MKSWLLLVATFLTWPGCSSQNGGRNCSSPPRIENGDITTLSEKQYGSGSSVKFTCQKYYAMEGQKISFCNNGTWTKVPVCLDPCIISRAELERQKIDVKYGMNASENIFVQRGHSIELICRTGHVLATDSSQSASIIDCNGTPPVIPKCKEITCNSPRITNGYLQSQKTIYYNGDLIRIQCYSGFTFQPDNVGNVIECTKNGWSPPPKCVDQSKQTGEPPAAGSRNSGQPTQTGKQPAAGSRNSGQPTQTGEQPAAGSRNSEIQCHPPEVRNGHVQPRQSQYMNNDEIEIICRRRPFFVEDQIQFSKCTANGWDPPPVCQQIHCLPPYVRNGRIRPYQIQYMIDDTIQIRCRGWPFFVEDQIQFSKCTANGWEPPPVCQQIRCLPPYVWNGHIQPFQLQYMIDDTIEIRCHGWPFFVEDPIRFSICTPNGWDPPPVC